MSIPNKCLLLLLLSFSVLGAGILKKAVLDCITSQCATVCPFKDYPCNAMLQKFKECKKSEGACIQWAKDEQNLLYDAEYTPIYQAYEQCFGVCKKQVDELDQSKTNFFYAHIMNCEESCLNGGDPDINLTQKRIKREDYKMCLKNNCSSKESCSSGADQTACLKARNSYRQCRGLENKFQGASKQCESINYISEKESIAKHIFFGEITCDKYCGQYWINSPYQYITCNQECLQKFEEKSQDGESDLKDADFEEGKVADDLTIQKVKECKAKNCASTCPLVDEGENCKQALEFLTACQNDQLADKQPAESLDSCKKSSAFYTENKEKLDTKMIPEVAACTKACYKQTQSTFFNNYINICDYNCELFGKPTGPSQNLNYVNNKKYKEGLHVCTTYSTAVFRNAKSAYDKCFGLQNLCQQDKNTLDTLKDEDIIPYSHVVCSDLCYPEINDSTNQFIKYLDCEKKAVFGTSQVKQTQSLLQLKIQRVENCRKNNCPTRCPESDSACKTRLEKWNDCIFTKGKQKPNCYQCRSYIEQKQTATPPTDAIDNLPENCQFCIEECIKQEEQDLNNPNFFSTFIKPCHEDCIYIGEIRNPGRLVQSTKTKYSACKEGKCKTCSSTSLNYFQNNQEMITKSFLQSKQKIENINNYNSTYPINFASDNKECATASSTFQVCMQNSDQCKFAFAIYGESQMFPYALAACQSSCDPGPNSNALFNSIFECDKTCQYDKKATNSTTGNKDDDFKYIPDDEKEKEIIDVNKNCKNTCKTCKDSDQNACVTCFDEKNRELKNVDCVCKQGFKDLAIPTDACVKEEKPKDDDDKPLDGFGGQIQMILTLFIVLISLLLI